jgi:hypothetical protein
MKTNFYVKQLNKVYQLLLLQSVLIIILFCIIGYMYLENQKLLQTIEGFIKNIQELKDVIEGLKDLKNSTFDPFVQIPKTNPNIDLHRDIARYLFISIVLLISSYLIYNGVNYFFLTVLKKNSIFILLDKINSYATSISGKTAGDGNQSVPSFYEVIDSATDISFKLVLKPDIEGGLSTGVYMKMPQEDHYSSIALFLENYVKLSAEIGGTNPSTAELIESMPHLQNLF